MRDWKPEWLNQMRTKADEPADLAFNSLDKESIRYIFTLDKNVDLDTTSLNAETLLLWQDIRQKSEAADRRMLRLSERFFQNHGAYIYLSLLFSALPWCYGAANGAMVLTSSGRLKEQTPLRLAETGRFVQDVLEPQAFSPQGSGLISILKVRLMHAAVRHGLLRSGKWDHALGLPINFEDQAATNLSFSIVTLRSIERLGRDINNQEKQCYLERWNLIASMLGLVNSLIPTHYNEALALEEAIIRHQFQPSPQGFELTKSLHDYICAQLSPGNPRWPADLINYLLGPKIAGCLGIQTSAMPNRVALIGLINRLLPETSTRIRGRQYKIPFIARFFKTSANQKEENIPLPVQVLLGISS